MNVTKTFKDYINHGIATNETGGLGDQELLIAAAPDMLAALEGINQWLWLELLKGESISRDSAAKAYEHVKLIIKQAKGE